jgi:hypothetical protein
MTRKAAVKELTAGEVEALLKDWRGLNTALLTLPTEQVLQLLRVEVEGRHRPQVVLRLFGRYNRLRVMEEREKLMQGTWPWRGAA